MSSLPPKGSKGYIHYTETNIPFCSKLRIRHNAEWPAVFPSLVSRGPRPVDSGNAGNPNRSKTILNAKRSPICSIQTPSQDVHRIRANQNTTVFAAQGSSACRCPRGQSGLPVGTKSPSPMLQCQWLGSRTGKGSTHWVAVLHPFPCEPKLRPRLASSPSCHKQRQNWKDSTCCPSVRSRPDLGKRPNCHISLPIGRVLWRGARFGSRWGRQSGRDSLWTCDSCDPPGLRPDFTHAVHKPLKRCHQFLIEQIKRGNECRRSLTKILAITYNVRVQALLSGAKLRWSKIQPKELQLSSQ